jgi:thymidylate synthase (FAD)
MEKKKPRVRMISSTANPYQVFYLAFSECYTKKTGVERIDTNDIPPLDVLKEKLKTFMTYGHESPLEHVSATFAVDNMSRIYSQQFTRHRIASFSQKSQRYVNTEEFIDDIILPDSIQNNTDYINSYIVTLKQLSNDIKAVKQKHPKIDNDNLRLLLPNCTTTSLIVTMNVRELLHFFQLRCCNRASEQMRYVANEMLKICKEWLPEIFENAGPSCVRYGICFEHPKFSCRPEITVYRLKEKGVLKNVKK